MSPTLTIVIWALWGIWSFVHWTTALIVHRYNKKIRLYRTYRAVRPARINPYLVNAYSAFTALWLYYNYI